MVISTMSAIKGCLTGLWCCLYFIRLYFQMFQVESDSLGANPVPTTSQLCDFGQVPQFPQIQNGNNYSICFVGCWGVA